MDGIDPQDLTPVFRTDFTDDSAWQRIREQITKPSAGMAEALGMMNQFYEAIDQEGLGDGSAVLQWIDDRRYDGSSVEQLLQSEPARRDHAILVVVDREAVRTPRSPVLIVDALIQPGRWFRAIPEAVSMIEANLSIANADWEDFADHLGEGGIYRDIF